MIIVSGSLTIAPADVDRARVAVLDLMRHSQQELGCTAYHVAMDIEQPGRFWAYEAWESDANLQAHRQSGHLLDFQRTLSRLEVVGVDMAQYEVLAGKPM